MDRGSEERSERRGSREGGLRRRLLVAFLGLSLVPLFGSNAIGYLRSRVIVERLVGRYLDGVAELQAVHLQDRLDQRLLYLEAIAAGNRFLLAAAERGSVDPLPVMSDVASPPAVRSYLDRQLSESQRFEALALVSSEGTLIAGTAGSTVPTESRPGQAVTLFRRGAGEPPILRFSAPVKNGAGVAVAYLVATIPLAQATEFLDIPEHVAGTIESFLLDEEGRPLIISHPHGPLDYAQPLSSPLVGQPPGSRARYRDREGVNVIGASARLPLYSWLFLTEVPTADALGELVEMRRLALILGFAFAGLVLVASWLLAGSIVAPVRRLVAATRKVASGDLETRVHTPGEDEIGALTEAFNEMAGELQAKEERIARLHHQEIQRAQQLATVGELASGLAHEIKNPVVGISNGLDLVLRRSTGDERLEPIASEMKHQLRRIETAVRDLLAFARPPEPSLAPADVNDIVARALTLVKPAADKGRVGIDVALAEGLPKIEADAELLRQAVVNLAMNATQFSAPGQRVTVRTSQDGEEILVEVRDEGSGMDPEVLGQLFKPFFTTRHSGTGLGLSISRGIVERHGGRIEVQSERGVGSTFTMKIPLRGREAMG